jgi:hypothetical protein
MRVMRVTIIAKSSHRIRYGGGHFGGRLGDAQQEIRQNIPQLLCKLEESLNYLRISWGKRRESGVGCQKDARNARGTQLPLLILRQQSILLAGLTSYNIRVSRGKKHTSTQPKRPSKALCSFSGVGVDMAYCDGGDVGDVGGGGDDGDGGDGGDGGGGGDGDVGNDV